ncbi:uncharacterized protein LOC135168156 [Diachasmimorpha longicaudata]|uniref:uncharacterized protein LOC135168156 n=1 Tax=Diachasmimorpha longicaudata TaxID=58733 RepID=UPI0030B91929
MAFRGRILLQGSRAKFIESLRTESSSASVRTLTVAELQSKLDMLENHWALFDSLHLKLLTAKDNEEEHSLDRCSKFKALFPTEGRSFVVLKRRCFNCLGKHNREKSPLDDSHESSSANTSRILPLKEPAGCHETGRTQSRDWEDPVWLAVTRLGPPSLVTASRLLRQCRSLSPAHPYSPLPLGLTCLHSDMRYQRLRQSRRRAMTSVSPQPRPGVILATALASLVLRDGASHEVRMLLDTGSELSFATRELVKKLNLPISPAVLPVVGISGSTPASNGFSQFSLKSLYSSKQILVKAYVLDSLLSSLPSFSTSQLQHWEHLRGLQLADPHYLTSRPVDLLIGADFFGSIVEPQIIKGPSDSPIAMLTHFGWVVLGPTSAVTSAASSHHVSVSNEELSELLTSFWQQEEVSAAEGKDVALTKKEAECEEFFQRTHTRDRSGRYIVRLPLVRSPAELGDSLGRAKACLASLLRRLEKNQGSLQLYSEFLKEYEELGHMVCVPAVPVSVDSRILDRQPGEMTLAHGASASGGLRVSEGGRSYQDSGQSSSRRQSRSSAPTFYFPHHCVLRESSETTKLRVVFNGSSKSSSGVSLNDIQHTGAKLQRNISDVLLWSRQSRYIFMTDITKMFRQIKVHREDWPLQQTLWRDSRGHICTYQLTTVTYGTKSAPFLACRVLHQLVKDEGYRFPLAVSQLRPVSPPCMNFPTFPIFLRFMVVCW